MRAVQLDQFGPAERLKVVDIPIPHPGRGEVLVKVEASGVIFADTQMRRGDYVNLPESFPFIPGREVSGTVVKVGEGVTNIVPGTRVTADMHTGGYAEYALAETKNLICLPGRVSFLEGVVCHVNLRIAYLCYFTFGQIQPGEVILLHAAAGGIGTLFTHIAKRRGDNTIIALSSSDEKLAYCKANGADFIVNYRKADYVNEVLRITGGKGVDVSVNSVGGTTFATDPLVICSRGRWIIYGYAGGKRLIDPYPVIMPKSLTLSVFSVYTVKESQEYRQATEFLMEWLETEDLVSVTKTFPLEEVTAAHDWIENQHSFGKIALIP
jgi:NADPH2:quinone reductase